MKLHKMKLHLHQWATTHTYPSMGPDNIPFPWKFVHQTCGKCNKRRVRQIPRPRIEIGNTAAIALVLLPFAAAICFAKPPAGADPTLAPFYKSLIQPNGISCCGENDCREVATKSPLNSPTHKWQVYIDKATFGDTAPNAWIDVPKSKIINDTVLPRPKRAVACWFSANGFYYLDTAQRLACFTPPATEM